MKLYIKMCVLMCVLCSYSVAATNSSAPNSAGSSDVKTNSTCIAGNPETSNKYNSVKWYRDSAERNAQYNQVFNFALAHITDKVKNQKLAPGSWGVVMDIDETSLDNTAYELHNILICKSYDPNSWNAFLERQVSVATPGSVRFSCAIKKMGGKVIMVTDRDGTWDKQIIPATIHNLRKVGLCFDNVVFANGEKDNNKTPRFMAVSAGDYDHIIAVNQHMAPVNVLAYFGDNIQDFPGVRQKTAIKENPNSAFYRQFGDRFFSLPNPIYGSWEHNTLN